MTYKTLPTPATTNKQVREYTTAVTKGLTSIFIADTTTGWIVTLPGKQKTLGTFTDKSTAIEAAKKQATATKGKLYIFDIVGELLETI